MEEQIVALDAMPKQLFARADCPIKGLVIENNMLKLPDENGEPQPLESFGEARVFETFLALAMEVAPIGIVLADGFERMGKKRRQEIFDRVRAKGFQMICTTVVPDEDLNIVHHPVTPATAPASTTLELLDI